MPQTRYAITIAAFDAEQLHGEIAASGLAGFLGLSATGGAAGGEAIFSDPLTAANVSKLGAVIAAHAPNPLNVSIRARAAADVVFAAQDRFGAVTRAVILTALDEINALRQRLRAQDAAIAAAATLQDLKTRWATLAPVPDRIAQQAKDAVKGKIDGGGAD